MNRLEELLDFFDKILSMFFSGNPRIMEAYQDLKEILTIIGHENITLKSNALFFVSQNVAHLFAKIEHSLMKAIYLAFICFSCWFTDWFMSNCYY